MDLDAILKLMSGAMMPWSSLKTFHEAKFNDAVPVGGTVTAPSYTIDIFSQSVGQYSACFDGTPAHYQYRIRHNDGKTGTIAYVASGAMCTSYDDNGVVLNGRLLPWQYE